MSKVVMFPQKKKLPDSIEKRFGKITKDYVEVLQELIVIMEVDVSDEQQYFEVLELVQETFLQGIIAAINEME